jgi:hypothetical protein
MVEASSVAYIHSSGVSCYPLGKPKGFLVGMGGVWMQVQGFTDAFRSDFL